MYFKASQNLTNKQNENLCDFHQKTLGKCFKINLMSPINILI
jgi:hypothetical protein